MAPFIALVSLLVDDYDEALAFYVGVLGFRLVEDRPQPGKRWVVVAPSGAGDGGCGLVLARASTPEQQALVGRQTGGRVGFFLHTDDIERDLARYAAAGVEVVRPLQAMPHGRVAVFRDRYGNLWDLIEPAADQPAA